MKKKWAVLLLSLVCAASSKSEAQVIIYSGTESETVALRPDGNHAPVVSDHRANMNYFVYDTGTGKGTLFRIDHRRVYLRTAYTLLELFGAGSGSSTYLSLSDGVHSTDIHESVRNTEFNGNGAKVAASKVPYGLPNGFPLVLSETEHLMIAGVANDDTEPARIYKRAATLTVNNSLTKASYEAHDSFDAAVQRLKARLDGNNYSDQTP